MTPIVSDSYKEKRKQEILESALICFAKKGFETSTVDDIVAQSGISKGAIYNYFKSKEEIYLELMSQKTENNFNEIKKAIDEYKTTSEKLDYLFSIYDTTFPYNEADLGEIVVSFEFKLHSSRNKEVNDILTKRRHTYFLGLLTEIIRQGQQNGELIKENKPEVFADLFWTMMDGLLAQTVYEDYPYHEVLKEMQVMFYNRIKL
ncbi:TetR/AcrR family transcriptional regulator [Bacillus sp. CGMCC 1.16607]|uniref:TetR/AcrR family transcriptional regulator n=1 Tax=Bacillus sp. CGMCC 1.16607 TaxID=3351842 RepID=UPI00363B9490